MLPKQLSNHPRSRLLRRLFVVLLALLVVVLVAGGIWIYRHYLASHHIDPAAKQQAEDTLRSVTQTPRTITVQSGLGFKVPYDANQFDGDAQVTDTKTTRPGWVGGESYSGDELKTKRNYTIVRLTSKQTIGPIDALYEKPQLSIVTNYHKDYFKTRRSQPANNGTSDLDILLAQEKVDAAKNGQRIVSAQKVTLAGRDFYKITLTRSSTILGTTTTYTGYHYITVNDGSPYWLSITPDVTAETSGYVPIYEKVIASITFGPHDTGALARAAGSVRLAEASFDNLSNDQGYVRSSDEISLILRNQIATVRVGSIDCGDIHLTAPNGSTLEAKDACNGEVGSGSIVSSDGYIVTNGHVVAPVATTQLLAGYVGNAAKLNGYIDYLRQAGLLSDSDLQRYRNTSDPAVVTALINLGLKSSKVTVDNRSQAVDIQTSNTPMRFDRSSSGRWTWRQLEGNHTDGRVVDYEFDDSSPNFDQNSSLTDVAIVKIDGRFPTVKLGSLSSVTTGDTLTAIGFPYIVDNGPTTNKLTTVPTVSQGVIGKQFNDGGGHFLVQSDVEIAAGNSGGPAFDSHGVQIGINTYGGRACDSGGGNSCFGHVSYSRDAADATAMLESAGISIDSPGEFTTLWNSGIDAFLAADYAGAVAKFDSLNERYPHNYLVQAFMRAATEKAPHATEADDSDVVVMVILIASVVIIVLVAAAGVTIYLVYRPKKSADVAQTAAPASRDSDLPKH